MDPNRAVQILLAAASALAVAVPAVAEPTATRRPAPVTATSPARQAAQTLRALYGILPTEYGSGKVAETNAVAAQLREALAMVATEEGKRAAKAEGLTAERLAEITKAVDNWEAKVAAWATTAGQNLQPLYGILTRDQSKTSDLAKMKALSNQIHDALMVIQTPAGQVAARNAKLEAAKLADIKSALADLDAAIAKLASRPSR